MEIFQFKQFQMIAECGTMREAAERNIGLPYRADVPEKVPAFDPVLQNNPLYHCYQVPDETLYPFVCAVDNPGNGNAAKGLFLELVRHPTLG